MYFCRAGKGDRPVMRRARQPLPSNPWLSNHAGGDDKVRIAVVNGGVLSGGDALDADVGVDAVALGRAYQAAGGKVGRMADFELDVDGLPAVEGATPQVGAEVVETEQVDLVAVLRIGVVALRYVKDVLFDILFDHEPGASAEQQPFALTDGMEPVAAVGSENAACFEFDYLPFALTEITAQKVVVVYLAEEADALRVLAVGAGQVSLVGDVAHLALHQVPNREHQLADLFEFELGEEIGLVFYGVFGRGKEGRAVHLGDGGVVACGGMVVVFAPALLESAELDEFVAHHVGIGCETAAHGVDGVGHYIVPVFLVEVHLLETAAIFTGDVGGNLYVLLGGAVDVALLILHADTDVEYVGCDALLFEQVHHYGAVHSS